MITHMQVDNRLYMDYRGSTLTIWIDMQSVKVIELFKLHISLVFFTWGKESSTNSSVFATLMDTNGNLHHSDLLAFLSR